MAENPYAPDMNDLLPGMILMTLKEIREKQFDAWQRGYERGLCEGYDARVAKEKEKDNFPRETKGEVNGRQEEPRLHEQRREPM